jgi:hypothetical protein
VGINHDFPHGSAHTPTFPSCELQTHNKQDNGLEATLKIVADAAQQPTCRHMLQHLSNVHVLVLKDGCY